eukprot:gb/GECG01015326.1/.p1 GENE.gb/GECG01015326.1/~~gb/GECG01015326.1/.p1  ORF type:complete len:221 (+),score=16.96 gb/GECG01015326.1/:1-663(+)
MGMLRSGYLTTYNLASAAGWAYVQFVVAKHFMEHGVDGISTLYDVVGEPLKIVQTAAAMEILHSLMGLVPSSVMTTALQVFSRLFVLYGIVEKAPPSRYGYAFTLLTISWSAVEVPRYLYLACNTLGMNLFLLKWLRYTLFAVLYPSGITGECWCIYAALEYIKQNRVWSMALPNTYNFAFNYHLFLIIALTCVYPYGSYIMYSHMLKQRKKQLLKAKQS